MVYCLATVQKLNTLKQAKRVVIKLGTGVLTQGIGKLDTNRIEVLCHQVKQLRNRGIEVILVSSGAIGLGMGKLGMTTRPKELATLQACASVGQSILINIWQKCFDPHELTVAQILLTREDLRARHRHNAVCSTIDRLLENGLVPIVNENDSVSAAEIKFGDNDTLSALVASLTRSNLLFILSNIPGLIDMKGTGEVVPFVEKITPEIEAMAQGTSHVTSVGGMVSKLSAAKIARRAGCGVIIGYGEDQELFEKAWNGESVGTFFAPSDEPMKSKKRWIAIQGHTYGKVIVDQGAYDAIKHSDKSLLVAGIKNFEGNFEHGDMVAIQNEDGKAFAHGLIEIEGTELKRIIGLQPDLFKTEVLKMSSSVVIHRDNLVLLD